MNTSVQRIFLDGVVIALACTLFWSCARSGKPIEEKYAGAVEWQICNEAEITSFTCALGSFKKEPALIYEVAVKNCSDRPHRYRLNIFLLDQDKAAGHLVPHKGKPPLVKPGETVTVEIPFIRTAKTSAKMLVVLKTLSE